MNVPLVTSRDSWFRPKVDATIVGRIGENLAAYYLEFNDFECSIVDRRGADIWCRAPSGTLFGLEVKTSSNLVQKRKYHSFYITKKEADQFMLTCLNTNLIRVFSREKLIDRMNMNKSDIIHMKPEEFTEELMLDDISRLKSYYS